MEHEKKIREIMDNFDFSKVHTAMVVFDWNWDSCDGVPSLDRIKQHALNDLARVVKEKGDYAIGSGGFYAYKELVDQEMELGLIFKLEWLTVILEEST